MNNSYTMTADAMEASPARRGRRKTTRTRLVYRLVHIEHGGDEGLARCRNISDGGLKLDLTMSLKVGARITVTFSAGHVFTATAVWTKPGECGLAFERNIDSDAMLRESAAETRAHGCPGLRLERDLPATVRCDGRARPARVSELTQHGIRVAHDGAVYTSARLSVTLGADKERHGVVRWSDERFADIVLLEPFSVGELGSLSALAPVPMPLMPMRA